MRLDGRGRPLERHGFDDVGIERALGEPGEIPEAARLLLEDPDELGADALPLDLRIRDVLELLEKSLGCIHMDQVHLEGVSERGHHALGLALPEQAIVDEQAGELIADGAVDQDGHDGRVHAPRKGAQDTIPADLTADALHGRVDERGHRPVGARAAEAEEVPQDRLALRRMRDLGVELDGEEPARVVRHRRDRAVLGGAQIDEASRRLHHRVPVAHPHRDPAIPLGHDALEQPLGGEEPELGGTVLAPLRGHHVAPEQIAHGLHAVADAEQRDARLEEPLVRQRGLVVVDARWAAREHDALVAGREHVFDRLGARQDFRVDTQLSDPAGDELGVLRTEVEDRDPVHHRTRLSVERSGLADSASRRRTAVERHP